MAQFFQFEADFVTSLRCIPMQVRYKLDSCGVKLKLEHWNCFSAEQKQALLDLPCHTAAEAKAYRDQLQAWVTDQTGGPAKQLFVDPSPPWYDATTVPADVITQAQERNLVIAPEQWVEQWAQLSPLQRFALIKLSRPSHENRNFALAMAEFGLARAPQA